MFCPNDRGLMRPVNGVLTCPKCGQTKESAGGNVVKSAAREKETVIVDVEKDKVATLPTSDTPCESPDCDNQKAYYYFRQTRAADEATTRFLECTECGHKWRDYR